MLHIALYEPEIPPNTGNIIRLCANTGSHLHLIHPLGFVLDDAKLRRAGLDYREWAQVREHASFAAFSDQLPGRCLAFSTKAGRRLDSVAFRSDDTLLFGPESRGLPEAILASHRPDRLARIPMIPGSRSLNLSNAVAVALYEAWRQLGYAGALDPAPTL